MNVKQQAKSVSFTVLSFFLVVLLSLISYATAQAVCTMPGAPMVYDPGMSVTSGASYTVNWNPVTGADSYEICEATNISFAGETCATVTAPALSNSYSHTVTATTTYYYRVRSVNTCGSGGWSSTRDMTVSAGSSGGGCTTAPGIPTVSDPGTSVNSGQSYTLAWSATGATGFQICEATNPDFTGALCSTMTGVSAGSANYSHTVTATTTYYYRVTASNSCGISAWSGTQDIVVSAGTGGGGCTTPGVPMLPDPGMSVTSGTGYTVSWNAAPGADSYEICEATCTSFTGETCTTVTGTSNSYNHTETSTTTYYYRVRSINTCGTSGWSSTRDMMVSAGSSGGGGCTAAPGIPTVGDPGTSVNSGQSYTLSWSATGATAYEICEATNPDFTGALCSTMTGVSAGSANYSHTVTATTTYYYRVKASNSCGFSPWSGTQDIVVSAGSGGGGCTAPGAPMVYDPGMSVTSGESYTVNWNPVTGADSYEICEATNTSFAGETCETVTAPALSNSYSHTVTTTTTYYYRVRSVNTCGSGGWSSTRDMTVSAGSSSGGCTTALRPMIYDPGMSVNSGSSYTVSWNGVTDATRYEICESTDRSFAGGICVTVARTSNSYSHTVPVTTSYYYRVRSMNTCGVSGWSMTRDMVVSPAENTVQSEPADDPCAATLSDDLSLHVPHIIFWGLFYWADFRYVPNTLSFELRDAGIVTDEGSYGGCDPTSLSSDYRIHIPKLKYRGVSYWADFEHSHDLLFDLKDAGERLED
ncbi:MAG: hypothetical protein HZA17_09445 [Nitrospirae bacterium]|nr:hypothetical protein [Nitrospirota bacterium]